MDSDSDDDDAYLGTRPQLPKSSLPRVPGAAPALPNGVRESTSGGPINNRRRPREAKPPTDAQSGERPRQPMAAATLEPLAARALPVQPHPRESAAKAAKQVGSQLVLEDHFPPPSVGQTLLQGGGHHGSRGGLGSPLRPGVYPPQLQAALERSLAPQPGSLVLNDPRGGPAGGGTGKGVGRVAWTPVARHRLPSLSRDTPNGSSSTANDGSARSGSANKLSNMSSSTSGSGPTEGRNPMTEALFAKLQDDDDSDGSDWGDEDDNKNDPGAQGRFVPNESMPLMKPQKKNNKAAKQQARAQRESSPDSSSLGSGIDVSELHGKGTLYRGGPLTPASSKPSRSSSSSGRGGSSTAAGASLPSMKRGSQMSNGGGSGAAAAANSGQTPALSTPSERVCIEAFGVSYFELVTKLAMEEGVLSEAESRLVLLLLSEPPDGPGAFLAERMLTAVVTIERKGITKAAIRVFRQELNSIASEVAKRPELVQILADRKVFLGRRASSRALMGSASGSRPNSHSRSKRDLLGSPGGSARRKAAAAAASGGGSGGSSTSNKSSSSPRNSPPLGSGRGSFHGGTGNGSSSSSSSSSSSGSSSSVHNHWQHPGALSHAGARTLGAVLASQAMLHHHHALHPGTNTSNFSELSTNNHPSFPGASPPLSPNSALKSLQEDLTAQDQNNQDNSTTTREADQFKPGKPSRASQRSGSSHRTGVMFPSVGGQPPTPSTSKTNVNGLGQPSSSDSEPVTGPLPGAPPSHLTALFQRVPAIAQVMGKIAARIAELPAEYATSPQKQAPPTQPSIRENATPAASGADAQMLPPLSNVGNGGGDGKTANREQVILVASGAFNPVHKMHLRHLYIARKYLEERTEFEVLGGLISPQHATTVRGRYRQMRSHIIPPKHRLAMARAAVGASTWLTVDPWEITRRRVMDYLSVLDHVAQLADACFPGLPLKVLLLVNPKTLMQLSPEYLRARGYGCLCVCRPQETDRLLSDMGSRWRQVAFVVEDAAILSRDLEATTSARLREALAQAAEAASDSKHPNNRRSKKSSSNGDQAESSERDFLAKAEAMSGFPVAKYAAKHRLGAKLAGSVRWGAADTEFELFSGLADEDMGYETEAAWKQGRHQEQRENGGGGGGIGPGAGVASSRDSVNGAAGIPNGQGSEAKSSMNRAKHQHRFSTL